MHPKQACAKTQLKLALNHFFQKITQSDSRKRLSVCSADNVCQSKLHRIGSFGMNEPNFDTFYYKLSQDRKERLRLCADLDIKVFDVTFIGKFWAKSNAKMLVFCRYRQVFQLKLLP